MIKKENKRRKIVYPAFEFQNFKGCLYNIDVDPIKSRDEAKLQLIFVLSKLIWRQIRRAGQKKRNYFYMKLAPLLISVLYEIYVGLQKKKGVNTMISLNDDMGENKMISLNDDMGENKMISLNDDMGENKMFHVNDDYSQDVKKDTSTQNEVQKKTDRLVALFKQYEMKATVFIKTLSIVLNALMGGGVPEGSISVVSGPSGSGKTTLLLMLCLSFCKLGKKVIYLDYEHALNDDVIEKAGLTQYRYTPNNPEGLFIVAAVHTFADGERCIDGYLDEGVGLIAIDSAAAMLPEKVKDKSIEDSMVGAQAKLMSSFMQKYKAWCAKNGVSMVIVNQMRTKLNFAGKTVTEIAGGNALKFYADMIIHMNPINREKLKKVEHTSSGEQSVEYGGVSEIWCEKNRYARPFIRLRLYLEYGKGINNDMSVRDYLLSDGSIKKTGGWYVIHVCGSNDKVHGDGELMDWIAKNRQKISEHIKANGGFKLLW